MTHINEEEGCHPRLGVHSTLLLTKQSPYLHSPQLGGLMVRVVMSRVAGVVSRGSGLDGRGFGWRSRRGLVDKRGYGSVPV